MGSLTDKQSILIKIGGEVADDLEQAERLLGDLRRLRQEGHKVVLCHGGGPQITRELETQGLKATFVNGQRVTDAATLEVTCKVLLGEINRKLVTLCNKEKPVAIGLSGLDACIYSAKPLNKELGFVGKVSSINTEALGKILEMEFLPIIASLGADPDGQVYNINADIAAGELAAALAVDRYLVFTNVEGLYRDFADKSSLIRETGLEDVKKLLDGGSLHTGMIPKIESIITALQGGVKEAVIVDGRKQDALTQVMEGRINGTVIRA